MEKENYNNIPISKKTQEGMTLTSSDRQYLQRMFCLQDEVTRQYISDTYDLHAKLICDVVREMLEDYKKEILNSLQRIEESIEGLKEDIKEIKAETLDLKNRIVNHESRLLRIEKHLNLSKLC